MKEIKLVVDNGKVYTIQSKEVAEIEIKKYDVALDLEYLKVAISSNRPDIRDVLLMDAMLYEKKHIIKEIIIGEEHYNNENKGYLCWCTVDSSGFLVIEILNEDSYSCKMNCKSDIQHLELVMKEHIELVALIERIVNKLAFKEKEINIEKVVALCSIYDLLTSMNDINIAGYSFCVQHMSIHKYYEETPKGIHNERIEELLSKKCLFKYGYEVKDIVTQTAINEVVDHYTDFSLANLKNIITTYENLFMIEEKIRFCDYENYEEETDEETSEKDLLPEGIFDFLEDISKVHYSGSVDGYDCFE